MTFKYILPSILQNSKPEPFYGPEDWDGGDPMDEYFRIEAYREKWDEAYSSLTFIQKIRYNLWGYF